jgi:quinol monooxygenase YgiN
MNQTITVYPELDTPASKSQKRSWWLNAFIRLCGQRKRAIEDFVQYVRANEPDTRMYFAWQQENDPTRFVHFFIFENEAAHKVHSQSAAEKRLEAAYRSELDGGDVVFTDYRMVAANQN